MSRGGGRLLTSARRSEWFGSSLSREADFTLYTRCGPEIGVASTKAFTGQLCALQVFTLHFALARKAISDAQARQFIDSLLHLPAQIRKALELDGKVQEVARRIKDKPNVLYLGRHLNFPIALEGALKLKEISYIHAEGYAAGEMKHGPIALIDASLPIVVVMPEDRTYEKIASNLQEAKAREGKILAIATRGDRDVGGIADDVVYTPRLDPLLSPFVTIVPDWLPSVALTHEMFSPPDDSDVNAIIVPSGDHELFAHVAALMSGVSPLPSACITPS